MDLKVDKDTRDLVIQDGDLQTVDGGEGVAQWLVIGHRTIEGTWPFNVNNGLPLIEEFLTKDPNVGVIRGELISQISSNPRVVSIDSLSIDVSPPTMKITYEVTTVFGAFKQEFEETTSGFWANTIYTKETAV